MANLALLCGHHHRTVHTRDWVIRTTNDGHPHWYRPGWPIPPDP